MKVKNYHTVCNERMAVLVWMPIALFSLYMTVTGMAGLGNSPANFLNILWIMVAAVGGVVFCLTPCDVRIPDHMHMLKPNCRYTLVKLTPKELARRRKKIAENRGSTDNAIKTHLVHVKWHGAFVPTSFYVDDMEEFVRIKVDFKYDSTVVEV